MKVKLIGEPKDGTEVTFSEGAQLPLILCLQDEEGEDLYYTKTDESYVWDCGTLREWAQESTK